MTCSVSFHYEHKALLYGGWLRGKELNNLIHYFRSKHLNLSCPFGDILMITNIKTDWSLKNLRICHDNNCHVLSTNFSLRAIIIGFRNSILLHLVAKPLNFSCGQPAFPILTTAAFCHTTVFRVGLIWQFESCR